MTFRGRDVAVWPLPRSGIQFAPEYEWREAAKWAGFKRFRTFLRLSGEEQSEIVAHYRMSSRIEAVVTLDAQRKAEAKRKASAALARAKHVS